ncbi:MAG: hypothetical protein U0X75_07590 [Acidobacteriota bacterium]
METHNPPRQEPPSPPSPKPKNILVTIVRDPRTGTPSLKLEPATADLTVNEQLAWRCNEARLEIRFSPNTSPFAGVTYKTAPGGTIFSGAPVARKVSRTPYDYTLLVTEAKGALIKQDADLRVVDASTPPRPPDTDVPGHKGGLFCRLIYWLQKLCCRP